MAELETPSVTMGDGRAIPQLGFGTFKVPPGDAAAVVSRALEAGYRHIDTAAMYGNEAGVGAAIAASGLPRDQIFVTTKLWNDEHHPKQARVSINASLERLGLDYVDLYLIHWPAVVKYGDSYIAAWDTLQEFKSEGLATSIGVSNFNPEHLDKLHGETPAVDQVELHPSLGQPELCAELRRRGIAIEAWSPLGRGEELSHSAVVRVAVAIGRTPAQVVIRWHLQKGFIVIPKSVTPARIVENTRVFDFTLTPAQMAAIDALDSGHRTGDDPATAAF